MELIEKIHSNVDKTIKYVFKIEGNLVVEFTYIDNNTGKDIICVATQTMCAMACSFCHLTDYIGKIKLRNLESNEIIDIVAYIYDDLNLKDSNRTFLVSYMGCGEGLLNYLNVVNSMVAMMKDYVDIKFGLSTMLPRERIYDFFELAKMVKRNKIPLKIHLSLHYTNDEQRNKMMPNAANIKASISAIEFYGYITGEPTEIHYTLIKEENDSLKDVKTLINLIKNRNIPVKFLRFNDKDSSGNVGVTIEDIESCKRALKVCGIDSEYYEPPGKDVGSSCGQFLLDKYKFID